ncbi:MAG: bifunctional heptose 7-phosphate kinase/heptose 1-phosphate adenyltransferase [Gammaproteobacteria bacterium]|nr:MAG: bifunctional heptose 7-phosphate kinase/heptose 1-phosphate adenyltransferase [Gammaproteobacteria bacterium]
MSNNLQTPDYQNARVLVVGDVMLDQFWQGRASKISPEAPVPVLNYQTTTLAPGGAGNVAMNLAALGAQTTLIGVVGDDEHGQTLTQLLDQQGIHFIPCLSDDNKPTISKIRLMSRHQQLLRVDREQLPMTSARLLETVSDYLADFDYIIASDYAKGALVDIPAILALAKLHGKRVLVDPKGTDFSRYQGAFLLTPNLPEFRAIVGALDSETDLVERATEMTEALDLSALLLTRSEAGMTVFLRTVEDHITHIHHRAQAKEVFDVTGAGDTVIAVLTASLAAGCELDTAVELANIGAGVVVGKLGTATVTPREIDTALNESRFIRQGFLKEEQLMRELEKAKVKGETIVMTNGCFDILHNGHVNYLSQAAQLGDRLLVAINTDESVARLKGPGRPANHLKSRANVLAALRAVDWVVAFDEDTPTRIIKDCAPDFLVKGGDNDPDKIPGAAEVRAQGGEVLVMDYVEGFSTTHTIERIMGQDGE